MVDGENPFAELEAVLADPPADGMFLTWVAEDSPLAEAGVSARDTIVAVGDTAVGDKRAFYTAMQPEGPEDDTRSLTVRGLDGGERRVDVPTPLRGWSGCVVTKGKAAWTAEPDTGYEPDFSAFEGGAEILLRCSLEDERAGYEILRIRDAGDHLESETLFRIGGEGPDGSTWDYRTRGVSVHRKDHCLSLVRTAFWEGSPGAERLTGDVTLADDGRWRGVHGKPDGTTKEVDFAAVTPSSISAYGMTILPLTMPLEAGATLTFAVAGDGTGLVTARHRLVCDGKETVKVDGADVDAWRFTYHHYGEYGELERFYVTDDRRLARVDWGENYGGCWGESVAEDALLDGVPAHVTIE
jgi:hypothetical protein